MSYSSLLSRCFAALTVPLVSWVALQAAPYTPLDSTVLRGRPEPTGPSSRNTPLVITEIMYNPAPRSDARETEFIELYNSDDISHDLSGFRLSGDVDFAFPEGTVFPSKSYRVVAAVPADVEAVYGLSGVLGGFTNRLANSGGTIRLRNRSDAVLLEVTYTDDSPWPVAADNTGHSLTLLRPSYGEGDPRAWGASHWVGGTPGSAPAAVPSTLQTVLINEILAHTDDPQLDLVELFNYSNAAVDLSGCIITDDPSTHRFVIPNGVSLSATGFVVYDQSQLGFALNSAGETVYLLSPGGQRVLDAVRYQGQENGVASGRFPDGAPGFRRLQSVTAAAPNAAPRRAEIVINEIMFHPPTDDDDDEFVELYNRSGNAVDLTGWRLENAVDYTFPTNFVLAANQYVVVGRNRDRLRLNHPQLTAANTLGNYRGTLGNAGEQLFLTKPDQVVGTNNSVRVTNIIHIVVDEVEYADSGRWSRWADGGGSSLELMDPDSDGRLAGNWGDSDETGKSTWVTVEHTGVMDLGNGDRNELHALLLGGGECLIDNLEVTQGGGNLVPNGTFESGLNGWILQGNHVQSIRSAAGQGDASTYALHLRATSGGDNGANRLELNLSSAIPVNATATIRGRARWLRGHPDLILRLHGNHLEAVGHLPIPVNLGTPGASNSRRLANLGPTILEVRHEPVLPASGQSVTVIARVDDPDGVANVNVRYRLDPSSTLNTVAMTYRGANLYSAVLPGRSTGTLAAFHLVATDQAGSPATRTFPEAAPAEECLVRWGDAQPGGTLAVYRLWMTQANINTWSGREKLSNEPLDGTFVYNGLRAVYNAGGRYRGSPFIRPGYNTPTGNHCGYIWTLPKDEPFLGADELNLDSLEPSGRDATVLREITSFWMADQLDLPFSYQRYVHVVINGISNAARGIPVYSDSQQPGSAYMRSWFANDDRGEIFKIDDWFEFDDSVGRMFNVDATLQVFTTTGGAKKQARYRWNWEKKFNRTLDDDYTSLFALVDAINAPDAAYVNAVENMIDVEDWLTTFALRHAVGDWDGYGYNRGKNQFVYKPTGERWRMLLWDLDFSLGCNGGDGPTQNLFAVNDGVIRRLYNHPHFRRQYFQALKRIADGPMAGPGVEAFLTAKYNALQAAGVTGTTSPFVGSGAQGISIPAWIQQRRDTINNQLSALSASFAITSNGGNPITTDQNVITLTGTAPIEVTGLRVNGVVHPVIWTDLTRWSIQVVLPDAANTLSVQGIDREGLPVGGAVDTIAVSTTGDVDTPEASLVLNEIQYNPALPRAGFIELYNRSTTTAFDLTDYRLNGAGFVFQPGTIIGPDSYLVVAGHAAGFVSAYGTLIPLTGIFEGNLDNGGETLQLLRPDPALPGAEQVVDEVTYDDDPPWPTLADGFGPSLQLIDPTQDNNRVGNWKAIVGSSGGGSTTLLQMTDVWKYNDSGQDLGTVWKEPGYPDSAWPSGPALLYVEGSALPAPKNTPLTLGAVTFYFRTTFNFTGDPSATSLQMTTILDDGAIVYLNGTEIFRLGMGAGQPSSSTTASRTVSDALQEGPFVVPSSALVKGNNVLAVEVHQTNTGSSDVVWGMMLEAIVTGQLPATPGQRNSVFASLEPLPELWLNEIQVDNVSGPVDNTGEQEPWVELLNSGGTTLSLSGYYLSDSTNNLLRWPFPATVSVGPGAYRLVWLDGEAAETTPSDLHTDFAPSTLGGSLFLTRETANGTAVVDYLHYPALNPDRAYGAAPDGTPSHRRPFYTATPGGPNDPAWPPTSVTINEWMAGNTATVVDPIDGDYDDWFELHNQGPVAVDLSGYHLTDNLSNPGQWTFPPGSVIPANGFLLVWADDEVEQNGVLGSHVPFRLSLEGDSIGLYAPNLDPVDTVSFGLQTNDISHGRWPDSNPVTQPLEVPTPNASNVTSVGENQPPTVPPIDNLNGPELQLILFGVVASDPNTDQTLTFSLDSAPTGASVNPSSGVFTWIPTEAQGPTTASVTVRVTDNGSPPLSATQSFTITVLEVNEPPVLAPLEDRTLDEGSLLTFPVAATDADRPAQSILYSLDEGAAAGMTIHPNTGQFTWTPTESQGPGTFSVTVVATDDGTPALNSSRTVSITVNEVNRAPSLRTVASQTVPLGDTLRLTITATDPDQPANRLTFSLDTPAPEGMTLDPDSGLLSWTPTESDLDTTNLITVLVTDDGTPPLNTSTGFRVTVPDREIPVLETPWLNLDSSVTLRWSAQNGTAYRLESTSSLVTPTWTDVTNLTATTTTVEVSLPLVPDAQTFYRVVAQ